MRAFDIPCLEQAGFEADDLIATYARLACEAQATTTIVSSDKDLMQLVGDCVIMYDTMKDKRIGRAEVIEKFGVGPEKVIEVQALIGDSTDNVPGVPGIGVKTAAQLIGEYGDLETLLKRADEIKQDKRRQTLIDNAEVARISKRLVTLDQNVPLDVAVDDLAVHEPDYKRLIAFLKAMEFTTLTRRVAEKSGIDASEIEADGKLASSRSPPCRRGWRRATGAGGVFSGAPTRPQAAADPPPPSARAKRRKRPHARSRSPPRALPRRARPGSTARKYETRAHARAADSLDRARPRRRRRRDRHRDHQPRPDAAAHLCGFSLARRAERSLLRAARPPRGRRPRAAPTCSRRKPSSARTRSRSRPRLPRSSRCWKTRACSRSART